MWGSGALTGVPELSWGFRSSYWVSVLIWGFGAHMGLPELKWGAGGHKGVPELLWGCSGGRGLMGDRSGGRELIWVVWSSRICTVGISKNLTNSSVLTYKSTNKQKRRVN